MLDTKQVCYNLCLGVLMATQATMTDHAGRYHAQQQKGIACIPPLQATCALLQVLFPTINMLTGHHRQAVQAIQEQKHTEQVRGVIAKLQSLTGATFNLVLNCTQ